MQQRPKCIKKNQKNNRQNTVDALNSQSSSVEAHKLRLYENSSKINLFLLFVFSSFE